MFEIKRCIIQEMFSMYGVPFVERSGTNTPSNTNQFNGKFLHTLKNY